LAVKASGGIGSLGQALDILNAGASRLGMSASVAVMEEAESGGLQE
jgi:deoxyribose-phosphate aldolase